MVPTTGTSQSYGWDSPTGNLLCANTNGATCPTSSPTSTTTRIPNSYNGTRLRATSKIGSTTTNHTWGDIGSPQDLHGILAPAATGVGETLALFERHLPATEMPTIVVEEMLDKLPADPPTPATRRPVDGCWLTFLLEYVKESLTRLAAVDGDRRRVT